MSSLTPYWKDDPFIPDYNRFYFILDGEGMLELDGKKYYPQA